MERDDFPGEERLKPPEWWHDAIRELPGNDTTHDDFVTVEMESPNGINYKIMSTQMDHQVSGISDGIYVNTNIVTSDEEVADEAFEEIAWKIDDVLNEAAKRYKIILDNPIQVDYFLIPAGEDNFLFSIFPMHDR